MGRARRLVLPVLRPSGLLNRLGYAVALAFLALGADVAHTVTQWAVLAVIGSYSVSFWLAELYVRHAGQSHPNSP